MMTSIAHPWVPPMPRRRVPKKSEVTRAETGVRWPGHVRLQKLCRAVGIDGPSQLAVALARQSGDQTPAGELSVSAAAGWWNGTRAPSIDNLEAVVRLTGGSADWLVLGEGDMIPTPEGAKAAAFDEMAAAVDRVRELASGSGGHLASAHRRLLEAHREQGAEADQAPRARTAKGRKR